MSVSCPIDDDVLTIEDVSILLRCAVDTVRRIPLEELPVYRVGKCNLYLREEVIRYLRTRSVQRPAVDQILDEVAQTVETKNPDVIELSTVGARERSYRRTP